MSPPQVPPPRLQVSAPVSMSFSPLLMSSISMYCGLLPDVCQMTKDPGPCSGYNPVWYFEPVTRTCRRFLYGGCDGNGNRFETREECQSTCLYRTTVSTGASSIPTTTSVPTTTHRVVGELLILLPILQYHF